MANINKIRSKVLNKEYEFTIPHFFEEMYNDNLTFSDIENAISNGTVNRKFTTDPRGTRYEIIGSRDTEFLLEIPNAIINSNLGKNMMENPTA